MNDLEDSIGEPIVQAAQEIIDGKWKEQFSLDVFQAGAGTSYNNERERSDRESRTGSKNLGIGIDEQTAIVVERGNGFYVLGSGAVYVMDGTDVTYSNIAEADLQKTLSIYNVRMHVLSQGDRFDLIARAPRQMKGRAAEKLPEKEEANLRRKGLRAPSEYYFFNAKRSGCWY